MAGVNIGDALSSALKGASMGMALGPIGAVAGGVGGLVLDLAPELGKWLFGEKTGATIAEVTQAVEAIAGTNDAVAATQAIHDDPTLRMQLRVQLAKIAADRQAEADAARNAELVARFGDIASARTMHTAMRDKTVPTMGFLAIGAAYLGTIGLFGGLIVHPVVDATLMGLLGVALGHFWTVALVVVNFYFGSSAGSDRKTDIIAGQLQGPTTTTTVDAPPAPPVTVTTTGGSVVPTPVTQVTPPEVVPPVGPAPFPVVQPWKPLDFDKAFEGVIGVEGGYSNDPNDGGGETKFGISKRAHPSVDIKSLTLESAKIIYKLEYWAPLNTGQIHPTVAYELFDFAVNSGCARAVKCLQLVVDATVDGIVGPETIGKIADAVQRHGAETLSSLYMGERLRFMRSLPAWSRYARGWTARVDTVEKKAVIV